MVVNNRQKNAIFFHSSIDGIHFRGSFQSVLPFEEKLLASPTQMPGPASAEECNAVDTAGLPTIRELVYSEKVRDFVWATKRKRLNLNLP